MKKYAIIHNNREKERSLELAEIIQDNFDLICAEVDDGLLFIRSADSASEISEAINNLFGLSFADILYVIELGSDLFGFGNSNTIDAIQVAK